MDLHVDGPPGEELPVDHKQAVLLQRLKQHRGRLGVPDHAQRHVVPGLGLGLEEHLEALGPRAPGCPHQGHGAVVQEGRGGHVVRFGQPREVAGHQELHEGVRELLPASGGGIEELFPHQLLEGLGGRGCALGERDPEAGEQRARGAVLRLGLLVVVGCEAGVCGGGGREVPEPHARRPLCHDLPEGPDGEPGAAHPAEVLCAVVEVGEEAGGDGEEGVGAAGQRGVEDRGGVEGPSGALDGDVGGVEGVEDPQRRAQGVAAACRDLQQRQPGGFSPVRAP